MPDNCVVSGIVYSGENEVKANALLTITPIAVTGALVHGKAFPVHSDEMGNVSFTVIAGAQYNIRGNVLGFTRTGTNVTIPNDDEADLLDLIAAVSVPSEGILIYDEGSPFTDLVGAFNFVGPGVSVDVVGGAAVVSVLGIGGVNFADLGDVNFTSLAAGQFPRYDGAEWLNAALVVGDIPSLPISKITDLQTTLDGKQASIGYTAENQANKTTDFLTVNNTLYPSVAAVKAYADALVVGLLSDQGNYDASGNVFPSSGGSGSAGAILKGDLWLISAAGTLGGTPVAIGDQVRALADTPGQTASNWAVSEANIGYVSENSANKATGFGTLNNTLYPTTQAVASYAQPFSARLSELAIIGSALQVPRVNAGGTAYEFFTLPAAGDVVGPGVSTDNAIARFDSTTGKLLQNSSVLIDDNGNVSLAGTAPDISTPASNKSITFTPHGTGQVLFPFGARATPGIGFTGAPTRGIYGANGGTQFVVAGDNVLGLFTTDIRINSAAQLTFSTGVPDTNAGDVGFVREGVGVIRLTDGSSGGGSLKTADPTSGVGSAWKLGTRKAATVALDTTQYIEVSVGGTTYKLGIVT